MRGVLIAGLLAGCGVERDPAWALDPIWIEPSEDEGIHGFQTWQLYEDKWERRLDPGRYMCAVLVEFSGTPTACTDCQLAWDVLTEVIESDCPAKQTQDPTWTRLERLSLGLALTGPDTAHPGFTSTGFADYGWGWEVHGQAWPAALDHDQPAEGGHWDGTQPFSFEPALAWPLDP